MQLEIIKSLPTEKQDTLVVFYGNDNKAFKSELLSTDSLEELEKFIQLANFKGTAGSLDIYFNPTHFQDFRRVIVVGLGEVGVDKSVANLKKAASTLINKLLSIKPSSFTLLLPEQVVAGEDSAYRTARIFIESLHHARYQFKRFLTLDKKEDNSHAEDCSCCTGVHRYDFVTDNEHSAEFERGLKEGRCVSAGVKLARDLGNLPANVCTPKYFTEIGEKLARDYDLELEVLDEHEMEKLGMGCYLAVGRGSVNRPYITVLKYNGAADKNERPYVFVGKGMTFDTGGYSIKPSAGMEEMKYDMCGGASVLGLMKAVAELGLPINVVGLVAGCENMIDANAYRPGDILKSMSGLTVEIGNTDAEGRLALCDSLTYIERYNPRVVIDIATLTGACMVALGSRLTGVFSNTEGLAEELVEAGKYTADYGWHMPLNDDFRDDVKGNHADITNLGPRFGGASGAAAFLSYFTKDYKWAHLDIAGTAWISGAKHIATGRPVSLMVKYLQDQVKK